MVGAAGNLGDDLVLERGNVDRVGLGDVHQAVGLLEVLAVGLVAELNNSPKIRYVKSVQADVTSDCRRTKILFCVAFFYLAIFGRSKGPELALVCQQHRELGATGNSHGLVFAKSSDLRKGVEFLDG